MDALIPGGRDVRATLDEPDRETAGVVVAASIEPAWAATDPLAATMRPRIANGQ